MMILGQDRIYENIAEPVWAGLLICSLVYLGWCVRKAQKEWPSNLGGELIMELRIKGLTKEFRDFRAVDHVSCTMERGVYGLLG